MSVELDRDSAVRRDERSKLTACRELFELPANVIYLGGNSLGAPPRTVSSRLSDVVDDEWGRRLVTSWTDAGWMDLPRRVGSRVARIVGGEAGSVVLADSTTVTLFKTMVAAARLRPGRDVLVIEPTTFPTDGYVAAAVARLLDLELRWCDPVDPLAALDESVGVLALSHVDFRSGAMYDLSAVTAAAHEAGAVMHWDVCHSAGAVPLDLAANDVDFAVGCTYKYLNGGPGSPAFCYLAPRLHGRVDQPLPGWMGLADPFAMPLEHEPSAGIGGMLSGTPPVLALSTLDAALDVFDEVDVADLREASLALTDHFIALVDAHLGERITVVTPREHTRRGSQIALRHEQAHGIVHALIARGVIGDFRPPDIVRLGFAPLYVRHVDVFDAVEHLVALLDADEHVGVTTRCAR